MERLAAETGETVTLAVLAGDEALTVAQAGGAHFVSSGKWVGLRTPIHCTADGKVLLAFAAVTTGRGRLERRTDRTIVDPAALGRELDDVRERGFAISEGEFEPGLVGARRAGLAGRLVHRRALRLGPAVPARPRGRPRAGRAVRRVRERARAGARRIVRRPMNTEVFVTCAVTGAGDTAGRSEHVPVTPAQIADAALEAARAGAAVAHIHVRDPETGKGSRDVALYREVVERVRAADVDVVLNLTAGMGGDLVLGGGDAPLPPDPAGTDMAGAEERLAHVAELRPEICTLDCGTMNFAAGGDYVMVNAPGMLRAMAARIRALGVRPELEVFDSGHLVMVEELIGDGLIDDPPLIQLCMGIPYGAPADPQTLLALVSRLPPRSVFSAFSIGRMQLPYVALAALVGGNVRVGLEDNLYLARGMPATNGRLVERAVTILEAMGARILGPDEVRAKLRLGG